MNDSRLLSVAQFAKRARTNRNTLLYYDKIELLTPVLRGENNYRAYSISQIADINLIRTLQELGMTLADIKMLQDVRTPEIMESVLEKQVKKIDEKIEEWVRAQKLLMTLAKTIRTVRKEKVDKITLQSLPAEAIILGNLNDYSNDRTDYDALHDFYQDAADKYPHLDLNYPVWGVFSEQRIKDGDWKWPDRFYFYNPEGHDKRPAGEYVVGFARGGYGQCDELYKQMLEYIKENNLEICGDVYEEYPLNEVCISDKNNYLIRLLIPVKTV